MDAHEKNNEIILAEFEQLFEIVEEKLLEYGHIAYIRNKDKILQKSLNSIRNIVDNKLTERIDIDFRIHLESYLFLENFLYSRKTNLFESSFNFYLSEYDFDEDSSIEISMFVSSNSEVGIEALSDEIKNIFRRYYISFFSEISFFHGEKIISAIKIAFRLDIDVEKIII